jgi:sugar phosphate isomerase/epimerase
MLREIRELGFEYAELSHGIRMSLVPGIIDAVDAGEIKISTVHNFCPLPIGINYPAPNLFKFSSPDRREREYAFKHSIKSLETAARVGARLVVLHSGQIDMRDYNERLERLRTEVNASQTEAQSLAANGADISPRAVRKAEERVERLETEYRALVEEMESRRERKKLEPMALALEMINRLAEAAAERGVLLGIENREAVEEIPLDHDLQFFLSELPEATVKYWHDCGHAQIKEHLGLIPSHAMHLELLADRLAGFHVHDVVVDEEGAHDHCPPGAGVIRWDLLRAFTRPDHIKVVELSPGVPTEDVARGWAHLKSVWGDE